MSGRSDESEIRALLALFAGALAIGSSGVFVRLSETGPTATAFWRGALALPLLAPWALLERRARRHHAPGERAPASLRDPLLFWAGVFFAGDLALWHWSLLLTSIAVSTLESNCAPILVTLFAWVLWGERPRLGFVIAIALAFGGMLLILAPKLGRGGHALLGDALGLGTAVFYAAYILAVARLRARHGTGEVMFASTLVFTLLLLPLALLQRFLPLSAHGWWLLVGCALLSQALGQSLIAYALAHLPPTFGAVGLYVQVIAAALYGWLLLGERLAPAPIAGGLVVLAAIALARRAGGTGRAIAGRAPQPQHASIQSSAARHNESR
ncbi:MAG TPA: DMT family transporter [Steroidobacteraceae bacterium]|nr:DMT family transporter [Steroidobacteraceae bacterium]